MKNFKAITLFIIGVILLIGAYSVNAGPFLVCDPDPATTSYVVKLNTDEEIEVPAPLHFDLSGINEGSHVVEVQAKNVWGVSSAVPFGFTKKLPQLVTNMGLSDQ